MYIKLYLLIIYLINHIKPYNMSKEKLLQRCEKLEFQIKEIARNILAEEPQEGYDSVDETLKTLEQIVTLINEVLEQQKNA